MVKKSVKQPLKYVVWSITPNVFSLEVEQKQKIFTFRCWNQKIVLKLFSIVKIVIGLFNSQQWFSYFINHCSFYAKYLVKWIRLDVKLWIILKGMSSVCCSQMHFKITTQTPLSVHADQAHYPSHPDYIQIDSRESGLQNKEPHEMQFLWMRSKPRLEVDWNVIPFGFLQMSLSSASAQMSASVPCKQTHAWETGLEWEIGLIPALNRAHLITIGVLFEEMRCQRRCRVLAWFTKTGFT